MPGFQECHDWVLLADGQTQRLAWLQSVDHPDVAFAVVSPSRYVAGYRPLHVARRELEPLEIVDLRAARVLAILGKSGRSLTLNLRAPLVINRDRRLGRQVIANGDLPVQHEVSGPPHVENRPEHEGVTGCWYCPDNGDESIIIATTSSWTIVDIRGDKVVSESRPPPRFPCSPGSLRGHSAGEPASQPQCNRETCLH